jgi:integrase
MRDSHPSKDLPCRLAGLRRGEALELPWSAVDWENHRLTVFAPKTERYNGNKRVVPIEPRLFQLLTDAKAEAEAEAVRICDGVSHHCLWRNFVVIRKRAHLPAWKDAFQVMRRNCETDWAQRYPQYAVSEWIGHSIEVSAIHYLAVPGELYQKVAGIAEPSAVDVDTSQFAPKSAPKSDQAV